MPIVDKWPSHSLTLRSKTGFLPDDGNAEVIPFADSHYYFLLPTTRPEPSDALE
jgi:hypothetical protein